MVTRVVLPKLELWYTVHTYRYTVHTRQKGQKGQKGQKEVTGVLIVRNCVAVHSVPVLFGRLSSHPIRQV